VSGGVWSAGSSTVATTAFAVFLNGRAGYGAIGAIDTAVPRLGFEHGVTLLAFVEPLARVGGHRFCFDVPACWAGQHRREDDGGHWAAPLTVEG
jgi:hypothetical protein